LKESVICYYSFHAGTRASGVSLIKNEARILTHRGAILDRNSP